MRRILCVAKIHNAVVTDANLEYIGSITIDEDLMDAVNIFEYERVQIANLSSGDRMETYVMKGERGSGTICMNGAAAKRTKVGEKIIIIAYGTCSQEEAGSVKPKMIFLDEKNKIVS